MVTIRLWFVHVRALVVLHLPRHQSAPRMVNVRIERFHLVLATFHGSLLLIDLAHYSVPKKESAPAQRSHFALAIFRALELSNLPLRLKQPPRSSRVKPTAACRCRSGAKRCGDSVRPDLNNSNIKYGEGYRVP